jgi:glycosyltransferase involved in cell wall biosynthesis
VDLLLARATGPFLDEVPATVRVVDLDKPSVSASIPALAGYLRRERPTVFVATLRYVSAAAGIAHALSGSKALFFVREASTPSQRRPRSAKGRVVGRLMRWTYARAVAVLAVSEGVARDLVRSERLAPEKVVTVYNTVVTKDLAGLAQVDPGHPWFDGEGPPVVLGAGSLRPEKDFPTLIAAFAKLRATVPARLVILGEGAQRPELERLARETGFGDDIELPGFVRNPFSFMARASVFALSSVVEGLPGVLIQALACGCPVVSTDCPSGPAEVLDDGRYGRLVPVGDAEGLAAAIAETLAAPPDPAVLRRRADLYAADRVVAAHLAVFDGALGTRRP